MAMATSLCYAQNSKSNQEDFNAFRKGLHQDFNEFRKEIMQEYIEFVRNPWKEEQSVAPVPKPEVKPVPPVVVPKNDSVPVKDNPIVIEEVVKPKPVTPQPKPVEPIPEIKENEDKVVEMMFYDTPCKVRYCDDNSYKVANVTEDGIADALSTLSSSKFDNTIHDCLTLRENLKLCDWAYIQLLQAVTDKICGKSTNESTLLMAYVFIQSGYKMRLANDGTRLYMLFASRHLIYDVPSFYTNGERYYGVTKLPSQLRICQASFRGEQKLSLQITKQPLFVKDMSEARTITAKGFPSLKFTTSVNKNLLSFYETYPASYYDNDYMTQWSQYANTPMSAEITNTLYPAIKRLITGKSEYDSVNRILNWVQTGFEYEYDDKIWGRDRTFFAEESLYYPYCDCEDRSVLLTRIIRDVLGLECILVYYPGHLATAVHFNSEVRGDHILLNGKRYTICDPTYIGAPVGMTMLGMNNSKANVILLR